MERIFATRKKPIHENVSGLLKLGLFGFLLIASSQYKYKEPEQKQQESKFVSAYAPKSQQRDKPDASGISKQQSFNEQAVSNGLLK
jgi:hypothetical protein